MSALSIYSGRECIGEVVGDKQSGWDALDAEGQEIGHFPTREEAEAAVVAAATGRAAG